MKVYINEEEVLCASNIQINKKLANTSSTILNNVYPKSWEQDKDYVSRFYMPKDYSPCEIIDENITSQKEYDLSNNIIYINDKYIGGTNKKIYYKKDAKMVCIKTAPGLEYKIKTLYERTGSIAIYETDSLNIGVITTDVASINSSTTEVTVTPTKKYLIATYLYNDNTYLDFKSVTLTTTNNLIFAGVVKNSGNIALNPRYPHYATLQLLDYETFLSESDNLNYVLEEQTVSSAIKRVVRDLEGFYVGEIDIINDDTIHAYNCNEKTAYDVFEYLAEITGSIWYAKTINNKITLINFVSVDNMPKKEDIEYDTNYFSQNEILDIYYSYNTKDYRNKQVIVSDKAISGIPQKEYITYNGGDLKTTYPISSVESIKSGNSEYSVLPIQAKSNGVYATFYYTDKYIDVNRSFEIGKVFEVTYYSVVNARQVIYNEDEILRINEQTSRNGIIARYEKRTDTNDIEHLNQIAQSYIDFKGTPEIILTVKSQKDLFEVGERVFFNAPLNDLKTNYLIIEKNIEMTIVGNDKTIFYTYKLSSSFNDENAINFFDNQRRKLIGNIKEGEYITRYIDLYSTTNIIFYDLQVEETEIPPDILDGVLDVEMVGE